MNVRLRALQKPSIEGMIGAFIIIMCTGTLGLVEKKQSFVEGEVRQGAA